MNSILSYGVSIGITAFILLGAFALLPDASDHVFPTEIATAITTLYQWLYSFNNIFPVGTLITVVSYTLGLEIVLNFLMPVIFWLINQFK